MAHKDWKGPGVYDCWNADGRWVWMAELTKHSMTENYTYRKCEDFEPPKMPESELENGVYWVVHVNGRRTIMSLVEGRWFLSTGTICSDKILTVLGKIPIDPI